MLASPRGHPLNAGRWRKVLLNTDCRWSWSCSAVKVASERPSHKKLSVKGGEKKKCTIKLSALHKTRCLIWKVWLVHRRLEAHRQPVAKPAGLSSPGTALLHASVLRRKWGSEKEKETNGFQSKSTAVSGVQFAWTEKGRDCSVPVISRPVFFLCRQGKCTEVAKLFLLCTIAKVWRLVYKKERKKESGKKERSTDSTSLLK